MTSELGEPAGPAVQEQPRPQRNGISHGYGQGWLVRPEPGSWAKDASTANVSTGEGKYMYIGIGTVVLIVIIVLVVLMLRRR